MRSTTLDTTKGSPWKLIAGFALPVLLSQIFQQLYNTADTLIVGRYLGDEALAAVSSSGPLIFLLISFFEGLTMGASVTISRYFGAGDHDRVQRAIHTNILVSTCSGIFLTGFGIIMTPQILRWMGRIRKSCRTRSRISAIISQVCWPWCSTTRARAS